MTTGVRKGKENEIEKRKRRENDVKEKENNSYGVDEEDEKRKRGEMGTGGLIEESGKGEWQKEL